MAVSTTNQEMAVVSEIQLGEYYDIGHGRLRIWEDRIKKDKLVTDGGLELYFGLVADGVGGTGAGEAASQAVVDSVTAFLQQSKGSDVLMIAEQALEQAHKNVREISTSNPALRSMSTTATLAVVHQGVLYLAHVGDSRAYLVREGQLFQLTLDHSWGNEMVRQSRFTQEEINVHPKREELARYIGQPAHIPLEVDAGYRMLPGDGSDPSPAKSEINHQGLPLLPGDVILLCSDGLIKERHNGPGHYVEPQEILDEVRRTQQDPDVLAKMLVSRALGRQTDDNVSVVIMEAPGERKGAALPGLALPLNLPALSGPGKRTTWMVVSAAGLIAIALLVVGLLTNRSTAASQAPVPTFTQMASAVPVISNGPTALAVRLSGVVSYKLPKGSDTLLNQGDLLPLDQGVEVYTAPGGMLELGFADGQLFLGSDSRVRLDQVAGSKANNLIFVHGKILVAGPLWSIQADQREFRAEGSNAVMGVRFEPDSGDFLVDCLDGTCRLGESILQRGSQMAYRGGRLDNEIAGADYASWMELAPQLVPQPTPTTAPTYTPMPTEAPMPEATEKPTVSQPQPTQAPTKEKRRPSGGGSDPLPTKDAGGG